MNDEDYRLDVVSAAAARSEATARSSREGFVAEVVDRLRDAGELPDAEIISAEILTGQRGRKLEIDAHAIDDADGSLHLFAAIFEGGPAVPPVLTLTEARERGFSRLLAVYDHARSGWLEENIEESRPLWAVARRIRTSSTVSAVRLHLLTDRYLSERVREIADDKTSDNVRVTFQIWDVTRLTRIHEARNARDDLVVDFSEFAGGGLPVLPAAVGNAGYAAYLAVVPAEILADIYLRHGSRLLEGNVRTFLGRRGNVNKGIANTLGSHPERFFAYNNGIAATAAAVSLQKQDDGSLVLTSASDLQIVNGAQTTASLASARRDGKPSLSDVFVPMKLSVVEAETASQIIPLISRYSNSQNAVRASDFFANHMFHRRVEEMSRRILAPAVGGSQVQTHWYYERARGQHLNDQTGLAGSKRESFVRINPKRQVITKTDLAKVECCFAGFPDTACRGAEKSFIDFAERTTKAWEDEATRAGFGDEWFRAAVARVILFRTCERLVSEASWYEGGYRAQIVAYACARLARLAFEVSDGGLLDYGRIWAQQEAGEMLERQMASIAECMSMVLRSPPQSGQNISEWAKQQACRKRALESEVQVEPGFEDHVVQVGDVRVQARAARADGRADLAIDAVIQVQQRGADFWTRLRSAAGSMGLMSAEDDRAFYPALRGQIPTDRQAARLVEVLRRCEDAGWSG